MNEQLIIKMAKPFVKDGFLTYEQFDAIYNMLSRREQFQVIDVLNDHDIEIIDEETEERNEGVQQIDSEHREEHPEMETESINKHVSELFVNPVASPTQAPTAYGKIKQSNEILCYLIQQGNRQASQDLCRKNRGLILKYAYRYYRFFGNDLEMDDLEQAGYIGLLRAADSFDIARSTCFTTYAVYWIKQSMTRQIMDTGYPIRLPVYIVEMMKKVTRLEVEYENKGISYEDRVPLIAEALGCSEAKIRECIEFRTQFRKTISLNMMVGEAEDTALCEIVPDTTQLTPEEMVVEHMQNEALNNALNQLSTRERNIINLRYGINGGKPLTLEEIGTIYHVTRECIRQIQEKAMRKLRRFQALRALAVD